MKHYIIGDIHGEYQMLLSLVSKLPKDSKLIFVGDMINRGFESKEVVEFVRKNAFYVVRGNHEEYLLKYGSLFFEHMKGKKDNNSPIWVYKAISSTLRSYGILSKDSSKIIFNKEGIKRLKDDMNWIAKLPLYLELGYRKGYNLPVVVTHGSVDKYWLFKDTFPEYFEYHVLNNRNRPSRNAPIFNIYGHKSNSEVVIGSNFVSLDTGCGKKENGKLSAYCLESKEVISVQKTSSFFREVA
jgi:serine/threonine protein phosphatase 1